MIGYLNKWVSSKRTTKLIMLWTNLLHQGCLQTIVIYRNGTKCFIYCSCKFPSKLTWAAHRDSKNEIENTIFTTTFFNRETFYCDICDILLRSKHWGLKKLILRNNDKLSETHYRLVVINGVYATRHVTHSIIY